MLGAWWWLDRWRKSTAYRDMTPEQKGMYRELLDECWLRPDGIIPDDDRVLGLIVGDPERWKVLRPTILARFRRVEGGWTHETALEVMAQSRRRRENQRAYRERRADRSRADNGGGNGGDNAADHGPITNPILRLQSPSPVSVSSHQSPTNETARAATQKELPQLRNPVLAQWRLWLRLTSHTGKADTSRRTPLPLARDITRRLEEWGEDPLALVVVIASRDEWYRERGLQVLMRNQPLLRKGQPPEERLDHVAKLFEKVGQQNRLSDEERHALVVEGFDSTVEYARQAGWSITE